MGETESPIKEADHGHLTKGIAVVAHREGGTTHHQPQMTGGATRNSLSSSMKEITGVQAAQETITEMEEHTETEVCTNCFMFMFPAKKVSIFGIIDRPVFHQVEKIVTRVQRLKSDHSKEWGKCL